MSRDLVVIRWNFPPNGDRWYDSRPMKRRHVKALFPILRRNGLQFVVLRGKDR